MDKILYASCAVAVILIIVTVAIIIKNRCTDTGIVCIRETRMTAVIGVMLIALGFFFVYLKLTDASIAGIDTNSYWFVAGFSLLCYTLGEFALLFTFVKRVVLFEDRIEDCSFLGKRKTLYWADIIKVERPMMKKAFVLTDRDDNVISISGDNKACNKFVEIAKTKVMEDNGTSLLQQVEHRLKGKL